MRLTLPLIVLAGTLAFAQDNVPTPADVKPGSITCEDVPYPQPVAYLSFTMYGQDVRMAYMDVAPAGQPNGRTVVLLHGMNFAGFYWGGPIDVLRREGFRVCPTTSTTWRSTRVVCFSSSTSRRRSSSATRWAACSPRVSRRSIRP